MRSPFLEANKFGYIILCFGSILALILAYLFEHVGGYAPCVLCVYQRVPYVLIAIITIFIVTCLKRPPIILFYLVLGVVLINMGLAFFHVGVEWGWFAFEEACDDLIPQGATIEDLRRFLSKKTTVSCKDPSFVMLSLSMAQWHVLYLLGLFITSLKFFPKEYRR